MPNGMIPIAMEGAVADATTMTIGEAVTEIFGVASQGFDFIAANPLMFITFVSGFVFIGFSVIGKAKKTARK